MLVSPPHEKLVLIAGDFEEDVLAALIADPNQSTIPVKAPAFGDRPIEMLKDIAVLTGGEVIWSEDGRDGATDLVALRTSGSVDSYKLSVCDSLPHQHP